MDAPHQLAAVTRASVPGRCSGSAGRLQRTASGRTDDRRYTTLLRDLILSGRAHPGRIVTHHGRLDDAPGFYRSFDRREDGIVEAVFNP